MKTVSTKKLLTIMLSAILVISAGYGLFFWQLRALNARVVMTEGEIEVADTKTERLRSIAETLEGMRPQIDTIHSYFVGSGNDGAVAFLEKLESVAANSGVSMKKKALNLEALDPKAKDDYWEILRIDVEAVGSWRSVFHFLAQVESLPYKISVRNASFVSGAGEGEDKSSAWVLNASIVVLKIK